MPEKTLIVPAAQLISVSPVLGSAVGSDSVSNDDQSINQPTNHSVDQSVGDASNGRSSKDVFGAQSRLRAACEKCSAAVLQPVVAKAKQAKENLASGLN